MDQLKFSAIGHNIRLMSRFHADSEFGSLIEAARSERQWKNLRTYVSIFGEYSTYMTEKQKLMTLKFLYELLAHKESDIRSQSAIIMGRIVAGFSDEYKKEVPTDIVLPDRLINNLSLWREYLDKIVHPDYKLTEQHKKWISNTLDSFAKAVLNNCKVSCRYNYFDILETYYDAKKNGCRDDDSPRYGYGHQSPNLYGKLSAANQGLSFRHIWKTREKCGYRRTQGRTAFL